MDSRPEQKRIAYGYERTKDGKIVTKEWGCSTVKLIFLYAVEDNLSLGAMKEQLESLKIPCPRGGKTWSRQTIANILSNRHYAGDDTYPQIVTNEMFLEAQKRKKPE